MAKIAADTEGFDLVISDWERRAEPPRAGLALLKRLREEQKTMPVVYYHGAFEPELRAARAKKAKDAGALGEAILPTELLGLVAKALHG
jgi:DNA-binding NtrC family response regulator